MLWKNKRTVLLRLKIQPHKLCKFTKVAENNFTNSRQMVLQKLKKLQTSHLNNTLPITLSLTLALTQNLNPNTLTLNPNDAQHRMKHY